MRCSVRLRLIVLALLCVGSAACFSQQVYKWKDAAGTMHYSQQPPPDGVKGTQMRLPTADVAVDAVPPATSQKGMAALDKANDEQIKHLCSVARQNQKLLDSDAMIASDGDIATATQLVGEQRERERNEAKAQVARYCHDQ